MSGDIRKSSEEGRQSSVCTMSPEAQRIAIAKACGWKDVKKADNGAPIGLGPLNHWYANIPDYLNDLNAMHEAALTLTLCDRSKYTMELRRIVLLEARDEMRDLDSGLICDLYFYEATAAQRAEAFLRTLGLWKEGV